MINKLGNWESQLIIIKKASDIIGLDPAVHEVVSRPEAREPEAVELAGTKLRALSFS